MAQESRELLASEIGERIRNARTEAGLSQEQLALLGGISRQNLHALERGRAVPGGDTLIRLAWALSARVEELLPEDYTPYVDNLLLKRFRTLIDSNATAAKTHKEGRRKQGKQVPAPKSREGGI